MSQARLWLEPEQRRRDAVRAARDRDLVSLWSLTVAHHTLHSTQGSRHTLRTYRNGLRFWLLFTERHAVGLLRPKADQGSLFARELEAGLLVLERERKTKADAKLGTSRPAPASGPRPLSTSSVNVYLAGARALYRALRWADATDADPFRDVKVKADQVARWDKRFPYPQLTIEVLLQTGDARHRVTVLLGAHAGLRASEMVKLKWSDVELEASRLQVLGKGNKRRWVSLSASLKRALLERRVESADLFVVGGTPEAARLRLRRICLRTNVPFLSLHALRHSAGTRLVKSGRSLQDVARHLGHASVATAEIYAKWADEGLKNELENW
ncbi:tyrosine-type recombinase/integrase [Deinococcus detaillensis]|uniref:tyrosine-type recombinase/integrase n=1 Tax=Deinococcus detaillensis TaxID=2592048 RepID=UPI001CDD708A|nr:site-specific integrase [Deinococcus detaillensis]